MRESTAPHAKRSRDRGLIVDCVRLDAGSVDRIEITRRCVLDEAGVPGARVAAGEVCLDLVIRSATGAFEVAGRVTGSWESQCRRCLDEVIGPLDVRIREIFEWEPVEGETWPIDDLRIDLGPPVREAAILALPLAPLCSPQCAGPEPDRFPTGATR